MLSPLGTNWVMVEDGDGRFGQGIDNKSALEQRTQVIGRYSLTTSLLYLLLIAHYIELN